MQVKSKRKLFIALTVICFVLAAVIMFIGFGVTAISLSTYDEKHTHEYAATLNRVETDRTMYLIYVNEYNRVLTFDCAAVTDEESFINLKHGDHLQFRSFFKMESLEHDDLVKTPIVTLTCEGKDIVTFKSSKSVEAKKAIKVKTGCSVFAAVFVVGAILFILCCAGIIPIKKGRI
ncbi:MAG: hypothetical protein K2K60_05230 [Clostridia bacterium]|nr:hypothetical protein [Clostridia bacterium]